MRHTILSVLDKLRAVVENDYALFELSDPKTAIPFLTIGSILDAGGQLEDEQLRDLAELYLCAAGVRKLEFFMSGTQKLTRGFSVRGCGEALYVDSVSGEDRLQPGDRILSLCGSEPAVFRSRSLMTASAMPISDRDDWAPILNHTAFCTVRHPDGTEEKLDLRFFPAVSLPDLRCRTLPGTGILYFSCSCLDGGDECMAFLRSFTVRAARCDKLILDLRHCSGGDAESFGMLAAVLPTGVSCAAAPHDVYYSDANCEVWEQNLDAAGRSSPEYADIIAELRNELSLMRGAGFAPGESDTDVAPVPVLPGRRRIVILTDFRTADEAESFTELTGSSDAVTVLGRESSGMHCLSHVVRTELGFGCSASYPMGASPAARRQGAKGIEPDIRVEWTPAEITQDLLLQKAAALLSET